MNKRRRHKAKARRRRIAVTKALLLVNDRNAKSFLAETFMRRPLNMYALNRRFERMFPHVKNFNYPKGV